MKTWNEIWENESMKILNWKEMKISRNYIILKFWIISCHNMGRELLLEISSFCSRVWKVVLNLKNTNHFDLFMFDIWSENSMHRFFTFWWRSITRLRSCRCEIILPLIQNYKLRHKVLWKDSLLVLLVNCLGWGKFSIDISKDKEIH